MSYPDPIAYTYDADTHCPACAEARFGRSADGWIAAGVEDSEGNEPGVLAPWDDWHEPTETGPQTLNCGDCGLELDSIDGDERDDDE